MVVYTAELKQTKAGVHVKPLAVEPFEDKKLCIVACLEEYVCIARTEKLREERELFIPYVKPHKHVSIDTISRWTKSVLEKANTDITKFSTHSTCTASTSAAFIRDVQ